MLIERVFRGIRDNNNRPFVLQLMTLDMVAKLQLDRMRV